MENASDSVCDLIDVVLTEEPANDTQFSDGVLEEYSSEDEKDSTMEARTVASVDPKKLNWLPWTWYQTTWVGEKMLNGCDYIGECLASFFGITSPKYQFEINEFYRLQALENERREREDLEMGGWNSRYRNNLIKDSSVFSNNCN